MARPRKHHLKRVPVRIFLTESELRAAAPVADGSKSCADQVKEAVLIGSAARARSDRIAPQGGHELGPSIGNTSGLELLIRASTPHGARVIRELIDTFEGRMQDPNDEFPDPSRGRAVFGDRPFTHNLGGALSELRDLCEKIDATETITTDDQGRSCRISFFPDQRKVN